MAWQWHGCGSYYTRKGTWVENGKSVRQRGSRTVCKRKACWGLMGRVLLWTGRLKDGLAGFELGASV